MIHVPVGVGGSSRSVAATDNLDSRIDQPSRPSSDTAAIAEKHTVLAKNSIRKDPGLCSARFHDAVGYGRRRGGL
jgi:hypothetical protein